MALFSVEVALETKTCPVCGIVYAAPSTLFQEIRSDEKMSARGWWCPNGHNLCFKEKELDALRRERDRLKQDAARLEDEARTTRMKLAAAVTARDKAEALTRKVKKRAEAALCPCCNRSFSQLARHMKSKHPDVLPMARKA